MKSVLKTVSVVLFSVMVLAAIQPVCAADEYGLSDDPRLAEPKESFEKGLMFKARGDQEAHRKRWGLAQKQYEHAEDYFLNALFMYKELGQKHGINTSHEMSVSDKMNRGVHVKINKMRKEARKRK